jgi:hypothetical protein
VKAQAQTTEAGTRIPRPAHHHQRRGQHAERDQQRAQIIHGGQLHGGQRAQHQHGEQQQHEQPGHEIEHFAVTIGTFVSRHQKHDGERQRRQPQPERVDAGRHRQTRRQRARQRNGEQRGDQVGERAEVIDARPARAREEHLAADQTGQQQHPQTERQRTEERQEQADQRDQYGQRRPVHPALGTDQRLPQQQQAEVRQQRNAAGPQIITQPQQHVQADQHAQQQPRLHPRQSVEHAGHARPACPATHVKAPDDPIDASRPDEK